MSSLKPPISAVWASTAPAGPTGIEDPGSVKLNGWTASSACPPFSWFNWVLNKCDGTASYLVARGIPDYDATESYRLGDTVQWTDGLVYRRLAGGGVSVGIDPSNTTYWQQWGGEGKDATGGVTPGRGTIANQIIEYVGLKKHVHFCLYGVSLASAYDVQITLSGSSSFVTSAQHVMALATIVGGAGLSTGCTGRIVSANVVELTFEASGDSYGAAFVTVIGT
jgi:hypothetical protein